SVLTPALILAIVTVESAGKVDALNRESGTVGPMQIIRANAKRFDEDPDLIATTRVNIRIGCKVMRDCLINKNRLDLALRRYGGIVHDEKAPNYVENVLLLSQSYQLMFDSILRERVTSSP